MIVYSTFTNLVKITIVYALVLSLQEEHRARDLFYALWVPDLFMERVQNNGEWSLFCPNEARGLADCWGEDFEKLYLHYEREVSSPLVCVGYLLYVLTAHFQFIAVMFIMCFCLNTGKSKKGCSGSESLVRNS